MAIYSRNGHESLVAHRQPGPRAIPQLPKHSTTALSESFNGLFKTELIYHKGLWRDIEHVEWVTLNYGDWFSNLEIHGSRDHIPLVGFEVVCYNSSDSESCSCRK